MSLTFLLSQSFFIIYRIREETVLYYYTDGTFTPEAPYRGRVETNEDFRDFSVSINNVSEHDGGVYWCRFNKRDLYTFSERTCLLVQSGTILVVPKKDDCKLFIYWGVIGGLSVIILLLVVLLVKLCCDRGNYTPKQQQPPNGVYEVMRGHTAKALTNPAYESTQRRTHSDLS
ncbi:hypothetical protein PGIGA_G00115670 [Pangasianodon gigas]|uniref:Uncharacterized protein n=1 Tax=Pangasianodon gigas TaxID=30993 RepID=A0ACC5WA51_PANGG|nr:hypothetical protein [Pangasianodon gigas]